MRTHKPLKGIEVGDIGSKMCFNTTDNGYMQFNNHRAPASALLSKYVALSKDGEFTQLNPMAKILAYGGMLNLRILITYSAQYYLAKMATIAARYSNKRK